MTITDEDLNGIEALAERGRAAGVLLVSLSPVAVLSIIARLREAEVARHAEKIMLLRIKVLENTRDEIAAEEYQRGLVDGTNQEREACAKIADGLIGFDIETWMQSTKQEMTARAARYIAEAIRSRAND